MRNIDQKSNSGKDHRAKGAKKIKLENGEGRAKGIVTYPGGDRIDWKEFEIPKDKKGYLKIRLRWRPPRPGGDLAMNVYDQYFHRVGRAKPSPGKGTRTKRIKVKDVEAGKYYIQIYAPRRMDAGKYSLKINFREMKVVKLVGVKDLVAQLPDPPKLPAVPEPPKEDPTKQPGVGQPGQPPGVGGPGQPGQPPGQQPPPKEEPPKTAEPINAKVYNFQSSSGGFVIITINKGKNAGVERGWKGKILRSGSTEGLEGGDFTIIKVTARESIGKVRLSVDRIKQNRRVLLTPP